MDGVLTYVGASTSPEMRRRRRRGGTGGGRDGDDGDGDGDDGEDAMPTPGPSSSSPTRDDDDDYDDALFLGRLDDGRRATFGRAPPPPRTTTRTTAAMKPTTEEEEEEEEESRTAHVIDGDGSTWSRQSIVRANVVYDGTCGVRVREEMGEERAVVARVRVMVGASSRDIRVRQEIALP